MHNHCGVRYGKIIGVKPTEKRKNKQVVWEWLCDCGEVFESVAGNFLYRGYSPGCQKCALEAVKVRAELTKTTHGMTGSKTYKSWLKIRERCFNVNDKEYPNYGAIGILMCEEWKNNFQAFYEHIGPRPEDGQRWTVDRIDNDKGYEPGNVRWATDKMQARNKTMLSNNKSGVTGVFLDNKRYNGKDKFYWKAQWRDINGIARRVVYSVDTYGQELARFLAEERRDVEIRRLNVLGAGYTENHGKWRATWDV